MSSVWLSVRGRTPRMFHAILSAQKHFSPKMFLQWAVGEARRHTMLPSILVFWKQKLLKIVRVALKSHFQGQGQGQNYRITEQHCRGMLLLAVKKDTIVYKFVDTSDLSFHACRKGWAALLLRSERRRVGRCLVENLHPGLLLDPASTGNVQLLRYWHIALMSLLV